MNKSESESEPVTVAHPDASLSAEQMDVLGGKLLQARASAEAQLKAVAADLETRADCSISDVADASAFFESNRRLEALHGQHQELLDEVNAALKRMREGRYGVSVRSGEAISFERLSAVPWTTITTSEASRD